VATIGGVRTDEIIDVIEVGTLTPLDLDRPTEVPIEVSVPVADRDDDRHPTIVG
jgi:hypothetical protein